eukprot:g8119.t1
MDADSIRFRIRNFQSLAEILQWDSSKRPEDTYCRATFPLQRVYTIANSADSFTHYLDPDEPRPKLMVCHDYGAGNKEVTYYHGFYSHCKSGNIEDDKHNWFQIFDWDLIDYFVYFTHDRLTVPPPGWTNVAHKHGTKVLGVFIVEGEGEGLNDCLTILRNPETRLQLIVQMVEIATFFGFDGYLLNFEVNLKGFKDVEALIEALKTFVSDLTNAMHETLPTSIVVWYDSITVGSEVSCCGDLAWQDQLTVANQPFFDRSDSILLNYFWKEESIKNDFLSACNPHQQRNFHVFKGIDIFARGTPAYNEGLQCLSVIEKIKQQQLSCALYAPGYFYEKCPATEDPICYSKQFWKGVRETWKSRNLISELPFVTNFCRGRGKLLFVQGQEWRRGPWLNLSIQDPLPLEDYEYDEEVAFSGGSSLKLKAKEGDLLTLFPLYDTHIEVHNDQEIILSLIAMTKHLIGLYIITTNKNQDNDYEEAIVLSNCSITSAIHLEQLRIHFDLNTKIVSGSFQSEENFVDPLQPSSIVDGVESVLFERMLAKVKLSQAPTGSYIRKIGLLGWSSNDGTSPFEARVGQVMISSTEDPHTEFKLSNFLPIDSKYSQYQGKEFHNVQT